MGMIADAAVEATSTRRCRFAKIVDGNFDGEDIDAVRALLLGRKWSVVKDLLRVNLGEPVNEKTIVNHARGMCICTNDAALFDVKSGALV